MTPLFSVIIPTYNRAELLKVAIQSVIDQRVDDWELIIVDDGSTNGTREMVNTFQDSRIKYVYQENKKLSAARNTGIQHAKGEYILFLDDDDYYLENHLQVFYDWLVSNQFPNVVLRSAFIFRSLKGDKNGPSYEEEKHGNPINWTMFNFCGSVTLCFPRVCFEADLFIPGTEPWEDTHLILRILAKYSFIQLPHFTYIYVRHTDMGSVKIYKEEKPLKIIEQNIDSMRHFFTHHSHLIKGYVPENTESIIISEKYSQHALNSLFFNRYKLSVYLLRIALKEDKFFYHWKSYLKYVVLFPLKYFFNFPKVKMIDQ